MLIKSRVCDAGNCLAKDRMREKSSLFARLHSLVSGRGIFVPAFCARVISSVNAKTRRGSRKMKSPGMMHEQIDGQPRLAQLDPLQGPNFFHPQTRRPRRSPSMKHASNLPSKPHSRPMRECITTSHCPLAAQNNAIRVANAVIHAAMFSRGKRRNTLEIEFIQDLVETQLMEAGHHSIARRYILYREDRRKARALRGERTVEGEPQAQLFVTLPDNSARTARSATHSSSAHRCVPWHRAKLLRARPCRRVVEKSL